MKPYMNGSGLSPWARDALTADETIAIEQRARDLGVHVTAGGSSRRGPWKVNVSGGGRAVELRGSGSLAAVIAGCLDDWQEASVAA